MRTTLAVLAAAACIAGAVPSSAAASGTPFPQQIRLDTSTGDGTVSGYAELVVTTQRGAYRVRGTVTDAWGSRGCVTLKVVQMHLGMDFGGNTVTRACIAGASVNVDTLTRHHDVVLMVDEPHTMDWESKIVKLTG